MKEYDKIMTVFERDPETKFRTLIEGKYATPEFEYLANNDWIFTEKVDGTNIRIMYYGLRKDETKIEYGGKTDNAQIPSKLINNLKEIVDVRKFYSAFQDGNACLYGEGYGAKIQKGGGNYRQDQSFVLFDVKIGDWWLERKNVFDIGVKLGLDVIPAFGSGTLEQMVKKVKEGFNSQWGDFLAEGIVARPRVELKTRSGKRIITKLKHKDF